MKGQIEQIKLVWIGERNDSVVNFVRIKYEPLDASEVEKSIGKSAYNDSGVAVLVVKGINYRFVLSVDMINFQKHGEESISAHCGFAQLTIFQDGKKVFDQNEIKDLLLKIDISKYSLTFVISNQVGLGMVSLPSGVTA